MAAIVGFVHPTSFVWKGIDGDAKTVHSALIYNDGWGIGARSPRRVAAGEAMTSIHDVCGRVGNLYSRNGRCPPFALYDAARGWMARDIPLWHCIDVIERYLTGYGRSCPSGSGDRDFVWLSGLIETSWYDRSFAKPLRPAPKKSRYHDWGDSNAEEERNQRAGRREAFTARPLNPVSKLDSLEPDRVGFREKAAGGSSPARGTKSVSPQPRRNASRPSSQTQAPRPKKLEIAVAWLRTELASDERPAAELEAIALCIGIAPRTYDRARKRLGIVSRRIGFGRWAKYMIALPPVHVTPSEGANKVGAACSAPLSGNSKGARDVGRARKE